VLVAGLSVGGILAAWAAQYRPVTRAVAVAPSIALPLIPVALNRLVIAAALRLPNYFLWWDRRRRAELPGPTYAYPRFATYALARIQRLGFALVGVARSRPPLAGETWVVTNGADPAVNNRAADALVLNWRRAAGRAGQGGGPIRTFRFPRRLRLYHDIVDPLQPYQRVALTYPVLAQIIGQGTAPDPESLRP
jgi:hypothetical protein